MKKKNLLLVGGVIAAIVAAVVYTQNKKKKSSEGKLSADGGMYGLGCQTCRSSYDGSTYFAQRGVCRENDTCVTSVRPKRQSFI